MKQMNLELEGVEDVTAEPVIKEGEAGEAQIQAVMEEEVVAEEEMMNEIEEMEKGQLSSTGSTLCCRKVPGAQRKA